MYQFFLKSIHLKTPNLIAPLNGIFQIFKWKSTSIFLSQNPALHGLVYLRLTILLRILLLLQVVISLSQNWGLEVTCRVSLFSFHSGDSVLYKALYSNHRFGQAPTISLRAPMLQNAPDSSNKWPTVNTPALIHCEKTRTSPLYRILLLFHNRWSSRRYIGTRSWVTLRFELCSTHAYNTDFQNLFLMSASPPNSL